MESLAIEATKSSPHIHFDAENHILEIKGESYPENAAKFYTPIFSWLEAYIEELEDNVATVNLEINYINSSSSKILMNFFDMLEEAVETGKKILVNWHYHEDNDTALECGEEFQEDLNRLQFNLVKIVDKGGLE